MLRHARVNAHGLEPVKDVEWPIEGDIRCSMPTRRGTASLASSTPYGSRAGEWSGSAPREAGDAAGAPDGVAVHSHRHDGSRSDGSAGFAEEFRAAVPRKLEFVDGRIPGADKLVLMLLATMGLRCVAALVGREAWLAAAEGLD